jgi:RNA polymerase sigma factor (sigma-70 family)
MTDATLVQEFARTRSPAVLGELAARHADWVYSAAVRMVGDADLAQDVAQAVFLVLVRKAATLGEKPVNAWLFGVTRFAAKHVLRERKRRTHHERLAAQMIGRAKEHASEDTWKAIAPLLDELVGRLNARDRRAILTRFYQGKSMSQVGDVLGVSEDAAKKRVAKAVKRLRELLSARGIHIPVDALGVALLLRTTSPAPSAVTAACSAPATSVASAISTGVIAMMAVARLKIAALVVIGLGLIPTAVLLALQAKGNSSTGGQADVIAIDDVQQDAAALYEQANAAIKVESPEATVMDIPEYPPDSPDWRRLAAAAWNADGQSRKLAHQARSLNYANWNALAMKQARSVANNLGDAAQYAAMQGDTHQAIEIARDMLHISQLLLKSPKTVVQVLVGDGIYALASYHMKTLISNVALTDNPNDHRDLQVQDAETLISQLLDAPDPQVELTEAMKFDPDAPKISSSLPRHIEVENRCNTELAFTAMSLACHIFKFENGRWPSSLEELVPNYLPNPIPDPWSQTGQSLGFILIKVGLPDGSDRPLIFSRCCLLAGSLRYLANKVEYGFYTVPSIKMYFGQFRDVARWEPKANYAGPEFISLPPQPEQLGLPPNLPRE